MPRPATVLLVLTALLVGLGASPASAQVSDTTWVVNGKAMLKVTGAPVSGTQKVKGPAVIRFLPGGGFEIEDATGAGIGGSWSETEGTGELAVTVTPSDILDFLEENLGVLASDVDDLEVQELESNPKLVVKKSGVGVLTYKLGFVITFRVDGQDIALRYKLVTKGQYDLTGASAGGETWPLDGKQSYKAPGNKLVETAGLQLVLGPDGGLADDRFALRDGVGTTLFTGYFTRVGKKIALLPDASELEDYVEAWIAPTVAILFPGGIVSLEAVITRFKATVTKSGGVKFGGKCVFFSVLSRGPELSGAFKSTYKVGAKG